MKQVEPAKGTLSIKGAGALQTVNSPLHVQTWQVGFLQRWRRDGGEGQNQNTGFVGKLEVLLKIENRLKASQLLQYVVCGSVRFCEYPGRRMLKEVWLVLVTMRTGPLQVLLYFIPKEKNKAINQDQISKGGHHETNNRIMLLSCWSIKVSERQFHRRRFI